MRQFSTLESVEKGEPSLLATTETVVAVLGIAAISLFYNSLIFFAWAAIIAPFLLLSTRYSIELGIGLFEKLHDYTHQWNDKISSNFIAGNWGSARGWVGLGVMYVVILVPIIASIPIRIFATVRGLYRYPGRAILAVPQNWYRAAFLIDSFYPAEIVLGYNKKELECRVYQERSFSEISKDSGHLRAKVIFSVLKILIKSLAIFYRICLKATSVIYLPFIWIVTTPKFTTNETIAYIDEYRHSAAERIKRYYAVFVIVILSVVPLFLNYTFVNMVNQFSGNRILNYFFLIDDIESWNITRLGSAIISWMLFLYADRIEIWRRNRLPINERKVQLILINAARLRLICTMWTLMWGVYLAIESVPMRALPVIRWIPESVVEFIWDLTK